MGFCATSQVAVYSSVFLSCVSFAIVMPSLWPYLHALSATKPFLAWVVAFYSVGEAVGAVFFGRLADTRPTRHVMLIATLCGLLGSALYVLAEAFPTTALGPAFVFLGRFAQGLWTGGSQAAQTTFLAAVLPADRLTPAIVTLNAWACLGFVVGPVFGLAFDVLPPVPLAFGLNLTQLTGPGYFVLASAAAILPMFIWVFDEERDRASASPALIEGQMRAGESGLPGEDRPLLQGKGCVVEEEGVRGVRLGVGLAICNIIFFVHFFGFALQETMTTPLVQTYYGWSVLQANALFTAAGLCALGSFAAVRVLAGWVSDRAMTAWSLVLGAGGYGLLVADGAGKLGQGRFLWGFMTISVAFPVGRATTISLYTKLLPLKEQGTGQGIILVVGAVARILGPFWAVRAFATENGGAVVFGGTAVLFAACLAVIGCGFAVLQR